MPQNLKRYRYTIFLNSLQCLHRDWILENHFKSHIGGFEINSFKDLKPLYLPREVSTHMKLTQEMHQFLTFQTILSTFW